jgi:hypothetical protein
MRECRALEQQIIEHCAIVDPDALNAKHAALLFRYLTLLRAAGDEAAGDKAAASIMAQQLMLQLPSPPPRQPVPEQPGARGVWLPGAPTALIEALEAQGVTSLEVLEFWSKRELTSLKGIGRADVATIEECLKATEATLRPAKRALEKRFKALLSAHGWTELLKRFEVLQVTWAFGFINKLTLVADGALAELLSHPMCRFLRTLNLAPKDSPRTGESEDSTLAGLSAACPPLLQLTIQRYGELWSNYGNVQGDLRAWFEAFPLLKTLELHGGHIYLSKPVAMPSLERLTIDSEHRLPLATLRALLGSDMPRLRQLTLLGLADDAAPVLLEHRDRLDGVKLTLAPDDQWPPLLDDGYDCWPMSVAEEVGSNHLTPSSVSRLEEAFDGIILHGQQPGVPPHSDEVPEDTVEGLPDLSEHSIDELIALLEGAPTPLETVLASAHCVTQEGRKPMLKLARALPDTDPRKVVLVLAALEAGEPLKLRAEGEQPESLHAVRQGSLEMKRPLRFAVERWDSALEQLFATDCLSRVAHLAASIPEDIVSYAEDNDDGLADTSFLGAWNTAWLLACSQRRAFDLLSEEDNDRAWKILEAAEAAMELYTSYMWESTEYDDGDSERSSMSRKIDIFSSVQAGFSALLYGDQSWALGAANRATTTLELTGGDTAAEQQWQWQRLLAYALEPLSIIEARVATVKPVDAATYTQEVCRMMALARHEGDEEAQRCAAELMRDARFGDGVWRW